MRRMVIGVPALMGLAMLSGCFTNHKTASGDAGLCDVLTVTDARALLGAEVKHLTDSKGRTETIDTEALHERRCAYTKADAANEPDPTSLIVSVVEPLTDAGRATLADLDGPANTDPAPEIHPTARRSRYGNRLIVSSGGSSVHIILTDSQNSRHEDPALERRVWEHLEARL